MNNNKIPLKDKKKPIIPERADNSEWIHDNVEYSINQNILIKNQKIIIQQ